MAVTAAAAATAPAATPSCAVHLPVKPLKTFFHVQQLTSKNTILGLAGGRRSPVLGRLAVSGAIGMTGLVTTTRDAFDGETDEGDALGEEGAVLGNGSSLVVRSNSSSLGVGATLNRLSKWIVAALFGIVILWKHDAEILWAALGSVINTWLSVTLKKVLNHQRPVPHLKSDPGMPSSHAQSIFYSALFLILSLVHWLGINIVTVTIGTFILACSSYLSWLRIFQQFHTVNQVLVGAVLGTTCATLWFWLWQTCVSRAFISSILVRIAVVVSSVLSCIIFVLHIIRHWLKDAQ